MSFLPLTTYPENGWTKEEIKIKMDELLDQMITASQYGENTTIEEEDSKIEIQNLQKTLKDSYVFLKGIYDTLPDGGTSEEAKPIRMRTKLRLDFQV